MAEIICLDTSILIDYYRKKNKEKSAFFELTKTYKIFAVSIVTEYEIMVGANTEQMAFWQSFFEKVIILPLNKAAIDIAIAITKQLKSSNKLIEIPDIFIAAIAKANNVKIATLNRKHFERIDGLQIANI